jgi:uncharacterized tellurite resistance protein B-like protein
MNNNYQITEQEEKDRIERKRNIIKNKISFNDRNIDYLKSIDSQKQKDLIDITLENIRKVLIK